MSIYGGVDTGYNSEVTSSVIGGTSLIPEKIVTGIGTISTSVVGNIPMFNDTNGVTFIDSGVSAISAGTIQTSYTLRSLPYEATDTLNESIGSFAWKDSIHNAYTSCTVVIRVEVFNIQLYVRFYDTTNSVLLGSITVSTNTVDTLSFSVTKPTTDALVQLQIHKTDSGGVSPIINSATLECTQLF